MKLIHKLRSFWCPNPQNGTTRIDKMKAIDKIRTKKAMLWVFPVLVFVVVAAIIAAGYFNVFAGVTTIPPPPPGPLSIDNASITSNTTIIAYVKNTGTQTEVITNVYVDQLQVSMYNSSGYAISSISIPPDSGAQIMFINATANWANSATHWIKILASDGVSKTSTVTY